ncbi:MAG: SdrD B-like domain-containing protein, partial [Bacteroidota bacterium]
MTQSITVSTADDYSVTITDADGCEVTLMTTVNVSDCGAIGNYVWLDENSDGAQDVGESGIPNVQVDLKDINGNVIATTYTDQN